MGKDVLEIIRNSSVKMSKGQRRISEYILSNYDKAAFMTAGKLGKTVGVSESTVVRYSMEMGFEGYPAMRRALQEMVRTRITYVQRIEAAQDMIGNRDVLGSILASDISQIHRTVEELDNSQFDVAVDTIISANRIYILGLRSSMTLSSFLGYYLRLLFMDVRVITSNTPSETFAQLFKIQEGDVLIGISFPRYASQTVQAVRYAKSMGATVLAISDGEDSPIAKLADVKLCAKSDMISFIDSLVAPLSLINALIVAVGNRTRDKLEKTFTRLENIWEEYGDFDKSET